MNSMKINIDSLLQNVSRICSDVGASQDAKELVPVAQIVQDNLDILEGDYQENLLPHLVDWFSKEFFSWFQQPDCERCLGQLELDKCSTNVEGNSVESYKCCNKTCNYTYDFIRHNDPAILIRTRRGRCGEWAQCFILFLRAFDYEARIVLDTTDHVWNEVWSEPQGRWVHVDPCEGVIDEPLLYELGWNKKLEYCLAFGQFEALDVTRRYSAHYNATKLIRNSCDEKWLEQYLDDITINLLSSAPVGVREKIISRRCSDKKHLAEIPMEPRFLPSSSKALNGRKTGSISWRIARGEFSPKVENLFVIKVKSCDNKPARSNVEIFELRYNSIHDSYESSLDRLNKRGWSSLTYMCDNLNYKYERDWKTSYISRYENCPCENTGRLQWRLDLSDMSNKWCKMEIQLNGNLYSGTTIEIRLECYESGATRCPVKKINLDLNKMNVISPDRFSTDVNFFDLIVEMAGGEPNDQVAWQKPQLFRQTRGKNDYEWPLILRIY